MTPREELRNEMCMVLIKNGVENAESEIDMILGEYEIQNRTTEIALIQEDRNEYLFRKFITAKIVKGCTDRTIEFYGKTLRFIFERIHKTADQVETDDIRYYLAVRQKRDNVSKTTANNELRVLSSFYQYLQMEEMITKNPTLKIEKIKEKKKKKKAFTDIEIEEIRAAAKNARESAIIEVLLSTGCRVSELVSIKINEIEGDKIIVHGKGEKDRTVYLNAKAQIALRNYIKERADNNPYVFCGGVNCSDPSTKSLHGQYSRKDGSWYKCKELVSQDTHTDKSTIENTIRKIKKRAGIESGCYPHKFRRTCATLALRRGMPIEQVSKMLGHESIETTQIYLDLNERDLAEAHRKYVV